MGPKAWIIPLAATAALSWLALRQVDVGRLLGLLSGTHLGWAALMAALVPLQMALRAKRWALLLGAPPHDGARKLFELNFIGAVVDNILFMRLGELARGLLAARRLSVPLATALSTIAVERMLDVAALLATFSLAASLARDVVPDAVRAAAFALLAAALGATVAVAAVGGPLAPGGSLERVLRRWPRLRALAGELAGGAAALRSVRTAAPMLLLSAAFWAVDALFYWSASRCLALTPGLTYGGSMLVSSWAAAGSALPSVPGAFGSFEAAVRTVLGALGVEETTALGYAVLSHMVAYIVMTVLGFTYLYRSGIPLAELRAELVRRAAGEPAPSAP